MTGRPGLRKSNDVYNNAVLAFTINNKHNRSARATSSHNCARHAHAAPARPGTSVSSVQAVHAPLLHGCEPIHRSRQGPDISLLTPCSHRLTAHTASLLTPRITVESTVRSTVAYGRSSRLTRITIERSVRPTLVVTHCRKQELMWASIKDSAVEGVPSGLVAVFLSRSSSLVSSNSAGIHVHLYQLRTSNNAT